MNGQTAPVRPVNNMRCKMPIEEPRSRWPSFSTIAKITCLVAPIIAYLGQGFITERPACIQWNKEVQEAEWWATNQKGWYETALDTYHDRAKLNCDWDWEHSVPFARQNPEILEFCSAWRSPKYPTEKIPSAWKIPYTKEDAELNRDHCDEFQYSLKHRLPGMKLSCFAQEVIISQHVYERREKILNNTLSDKPLLCGRVEKA